jgi:hypothetical protein
MYGDSFRQDFCARHQHLVPVGVNRVALVYLQHRASGDCRPGHYSADKSMDVTSQAVAAELRRMKMRPEVLAA